MFKPILHNLLPTDKGFKECQYYNKVISNKAKYLEGKLTLGDKIDGELEWKVECRKALRKVWEFCEEIKNATN